MKNWTSENVHSNMKVHLPNWPCIYALYIYIYYTTSIISSQDYVMVNSFGEIEFKFTLIFSEVGHILATRVWAFVRFLASGTSQVEKFRLLSIGPWRLESPKEPTCNIKNIQLNLTWSYTKLKTPSEKLSLVKGLNPPI